MKKKSKPKKYEPVLGIIDITDDEPDIGEQYEPAVVLWDGKDWLLQNTLDIVEVLYWYELPSRIKSQMNKLFGKEIYK